jgi:hypothetical protein
VPLTWRADLAQEEAETGDEVPEEEEDAAVPKEAVVVTVPADFTLQESCQALVDELASVIYRCGPLGNHSFMHQVFGDSLQAARACASSNHFALLLQPSSPVWHALHGSLQCSLKAVKHWLRCSGALSCVQAWLLWCIVMC